MTARGERLALLVVLAVAAALYSWGLGRALPDSWDQDEVLPADVRGALDRGLAAGWLARYPPLQLDLASIPARALRVLERAAWSAGSKPISCRSMPCVGSA